MFRPAALFLAIGFAFLACESFDAGDAPPAVPEAGVESGAPDAATSDGATPSGACPVVFVSSKGDESATGCDQTKPVKTIATAIDRAKQQSAPEIHVCQGVYDETTLELNVPVSLHGGFDCVTWMPASVETRVQRGGSNVGAATLVVSGPAVTHDTQIDGLFIDGPAEGTNGIALAIKGGAKPYVHDVTVTGGGTTATAGVPGATAIDVTDGAAPEIANARIFGGSGKSDIAEPSQFGSVGIRVINANPHIHNVAIDGSTSATRTIGMWVRGTSELTGANAVSQVIFAASRADSYSTGLVTDGTGALELLDSVIFMPSLACSSGKTCIDYGVYVGGGTVHAARNRIFGGEIGMGGAGSTIDGIIVNGATAAATIENNLIAGGNESSVETVGAVGVAVVNGSANVLYNTIDAGPSKSAYALQVAGTAQKVTIRANILGSRRGRALLYYPCQGAGIDLFTDNALLGHSPNAFALVLAGAQCAPTLKDSPKDVLALVDAVAASPTPNGNFRVASTITCAGDSNCFTPKPCTGADDCAATLFTDGIPTRQSLAKATAAWQLAATATCRVSKPGAAPTPAIDLPLDFAGFARTSPYSLGAVESDGECSNP